MDNDRGGQYGALVSWWVGQLDNARLIEPVGYPDVLRAMGGAEEMLAGYGGVRKGACVHGVPCGAMRGAGIGMGMIHYKNIEE